MLLKTTSAAALLVAAAGAAQAQDDAMGEIVPLTGWNPDEVAQDAWNISAMMDSEVYGVGGEEIGEVEDVIIGPDGRLVAIVAEVGGFWDIGDTHIGVPWDEVEFGSPYQSVMIPVTEENVEEYDVYEMSGLPGSALGEQVTAGLDDAELTRAWRASELIGDYARMMGENDERQVYGYVMDMLVDDGEVVATLVNPTPSYGYGVYGYPAYTDYGAGWDPGSPYYDMPYTMDDIEGIQPMTTYDAE
ncbi:PRC-barrel domain-containing protein [Tranquillimonas alkanivorans]|uniref:Sporulation protein YlmC, PRC-barrel domain family n=1 Tax=Tranquillimonas alkanivorans TaxID=441119 RepID=A0A1I5L5S4_9RHOB|nr:PRC-barrel domain-containing protein [Tranquillimonas alkanivorans]SFO92543.1 Sporulation protein YlmC, PRC-barrel domain family [Tranquillimonas alkanivorans]